MSIRSTQTLASIIEQICRGERCMSCRQEWKEVPGQRERELNHTPDCAFVEALDRHVAAADKREAKGLWS